MKRSILTRGLYSGAAVAVFGLAASALEPAFAKEAAMIEGGTGGGGTYRPAGSVPSPTKKVTPAKQPVTETREFTRGNNPNQTPLLSSIPTTQTATMPTYSTFAPGANRIQATQGANVLYHRAAVVKGPSSRFAGTRSPASAPVSPSTPLLTQQPSDAFTLANNPKLKKGYVPGHAPVLKEKETPTNENRRGPTKTLDPNTKPIAMNDDRIPGSVAPTIGQQPKAPSLGGASGTSGGGSSSGGGSIAEISKARKAVN